MWLLQPTHPTRKLCRPTPINLFQRRLAKLRHISSTYLHAHPTLPPQFSLVNLKFLVSSSAFPRFPEGGGEKTGEKVTGVSFFILCRKWSPPWALTGTQNISAASAAGSLLEKRVRAKTEKLQVHCSPRHEFLLFHLAFPIHPWIATPGSLSTHRAPFPCPRPYPFLPTAHTHCHSCSPTYIVCPQVSMSGRAAPTAGGTSCSCSPRAARAAKDPFWITTSRHSVRSGTQTASCAGCVAVGSGLGAQGGMIRWLVASLLLRSCRSQGGC